MRRNLGGWPYRPKTVFDAAARRVSLRAQDKLYNAQQHIDRTKNGDWFDAVINEGDRASSDAYALLSKAMTEVQRAEKEAHQTAKKEF